MGVLRTSQSDVLRTSQSDVLRTSQSGVLRTSQSDVLRTSQSDVLRTSQSDVLRTFAYLQPICTQSHPPPPRNEARDALCNTIDQNETKISWIILFYPFATKNKAQKKQGFR